MTDRKAQVAAPRVVTAALTIATSGMLPVHLTGALAPQLKEDLGLSTSTLGLATTAFFGASVVMSVLIGSRIDRLGWAGAMRLVGLVQVAVFAGIALVARSVVVLACLLAVGGFLHALGMPAGNLAILDRVPANRRAVVFGIRQSAIPISALLAGVAVPALALTVGWRWAFAVGLIGPTITLIALRPVSRKEDSTDDGGKVVDAGEAKTSILSPGLFAMIGATILGAGTVNVTTSFFVSSAVDAGMSQGRAGALLAVGSVAAISMRVIIGLVVDRRGWDGFAAMATMLTIGTIGWAMTATGTTSLLYVATPLMFGAGTGWAGLMHFILVSQHPENPGAASATVLAFGYAGGAVTPLAFGIIADHLSFSVAWTAIFASGLAAAALTVVAGRLFRRRSSIETTSRSPLLLKDE